MRVKQPLPLGCCEVGNNDSTVALWVGDFVDLDDLSVWVDQVANSLGEVRELFLRVS